MRTIDINSDLGESFGNWKMGNDELVIPEITSANVACGFHGSDPLTMIETVRRCREHGVMVGAHPGLPDLLGFGRRAMAISPDDAYAYIVYQAGALQGVAQTLGENVHHIKPHGAMYSILRTDEQLAAAAAQAILDFSADVMVYWPAPVSAALPTEARQRGIRVVGRDLSRPRLRARRLAHPPAGQARDRRRQGLPPSATLAGGGIGRGRRWQPHRA